MAIKNVVNVKDSRLRLRSKKVGRVDKKVKALVKDLKDTLSAQVDPEGVGLAAPQIGKNLRVFVMKYNKKSSAFINPQVKYISERKDQKSKKKKTLKKIMEGCLSLPHFYGPLTRPYQVKLQYTNESGKSLTKTFQGFEAQIIQHEIDHLNGVLFIDRLLESKMPLYELVNGEWEEVEI